MSVKLNYNNSKFKKFISVIKPWFCCKKMTLHNICIDSEWVNVKSISLALISCTKQTFVRTVGRAVAILLNECTSMLTMLIKVQANAWDINHVL